MMMAWVVLIMRYHFHGTDLVVGMWRHGSCREFAWHEYCFARVRVPSYCAWRGAWRVVSGPPLELSLWWGMVITMIVYAISYNFNKRFLYLLLTSAVVMVILIVSTLLSLLLLGFMYVPCIRYPAFACKAF